MKKSLLLVLLAGALGITLSAQDSTRGGALYQQQCASCHGDNLQGRSGPPLAGGDFHSRWPAATDLVNKIRNTMPQDNPGKLTAEQSADLAGYIQSAQPAANSAPAPVASAGSPPAFPPAGNLIQLMRGIMFPNSNIIFTVQTHNPGEKKKAGDASTSDGGFNWSQWGNDLYSGWEIVDYAALALADSAPLMLTPGRRCENGKPVPVDDPDWIRFTKEMAEVGRAAYRASQTRDQEKVSDISGDVADSCLHCHQVFRDRIQRGRVPGADPSGKELRCTKAQAVPRGR